MNLFKKPCIRHAKRELYRKFHPNDLPGYYVECVLCEHVRQKVQGVSDLHCDRTKEKIGKIAYLEACMKKCNLCVKQVNDCYDNVLSLAEEIAEYQKMLKVVKELNV